MSARSTRTRRLLATSLSAITLVASCGGDDGTTDPAGPVTSDADTTDPTTTGPGTTDPDGDARAAIDARSYLDDYESTDEVVTAAPEVDAVDDAAEAEPPPVEPIEPPMPPEPGLLDDNTFVDPGESTWTTTADDAESTFALDVDTGSFSVARRYVAEGFVPDPASIRIEEWVNAVDPGDAHTADSTLGIAATSAASPYETGVETIRVAVTSTELTDDERPPANLTFVIDTSGSMDIRERLGLVKSSLALLAQHLRDDDTLSIVIYGDEAEPVLAPTPASDTQTIVSAIERLTSGGSTNMEAGLRLGYQQARAAFRDGGVNVVVLASDGVANVGVDDPDGLVELIRQSGNDGISLVTVGYGMGNFDDDLMEQLADQGDGFYGYVDTFEEAERLFVTDLTPTLTVVARDAKSQVVFDPAVVAEYRLVGYENRALDDADFRDDSVDGGELGAGHHAVAVYEIRRTAEGAGASPGEARLRWLPTDTDEAVEIAVPLPAGPGEATAALRLAALTAATAELLRGDPVALDRQLSLDRLAGEADELAAAGVDGADEIADLLAGIVALGG